MVYPRSDNLAEGKALTVPRPRRGSGLLIHALAVLALIPDSIGAQQPDPIPIARLTGTIDLDGRVSEAAWLTIAPLPLVTYLPIAGKAPSDSTEIRLAYDQEFLYASARCFVSDRRSIRATSLQRDRLGADDRFRLMLDTFNDGQTGVGFLTTPAGMKMDMEVSGDGRLVNESWNTWWDAAASEDSLGWYAEIRIPWSSLRFQPEHQRVVMGLIVLRTSVGKNEWSTFPPLSPQETNALWRPSLAQKIVFEGLDRRKPLYLTPYALLGLNRQARLQDPAGRFQQQRDWTTELGGDFKYGLSDNLTLDLTANTDFAQVEADDQQVNLGRVPLFFPEKRQFFQERSGGFEFNTSGNGDFSRIFHSRRIGLTDDGRPVRIYGGGRLVGRVGNLDVGLLDLQVAADSLQSGQNLGVTRVRWQLPRTEHRLGGIVTSRLDNNGRYNLVAGTDLELHPPGNFYLSAQYARSQDRTVGGGGEAGMATLDLDRRVSRGLRANFGGKWAGPRFYPALGYEPRSDYHLGYGLLQNAWVLPEHSPFYKVELALYGQAYRRNADRSVESALLYPYFNFFFKSGLSGYLGVARQIEDLQFPLQFSAAAAVDPGHYRFDQFQSALYSPQGGRLTGSMLFNVGEFFDGTQLFLDLSPRLNLSRHLTLDATYQRNRVRFSDRSQALDADLFRLRINLAANIRLSGSAFVQYNRAAGAVVGNVRIRYQFAEGRDLYLVYDELVNTDLERLGPGAVQLPRSQQRAMLLKYTYTFSH